MQRGALTLAVVVLSAYGGAHVHAQYISTANQLGYQDDLTHETRYVPLATLTTPMVAMGGHNGDIIYGVSDTSELLNLSGYNNYNQIPVGPLDHDIRALAFGTSGPFGSTMFGMSYQDLYAINPLTAATTLIGHMGDLTQSGYVGAYFNNTTIFLTEQNGASTSSLYTVDPNTGLATLIGPIGFTVTALNMYVPPPIYDPTLYGYTSSGQLISINEATGAGAFVANITDLDGVIVGVSSDVLSPEPSTLILAALGGLALLAYRRRFA